MNVDIYQYDDYRRFIGDCYSEIKTGDPKFSYRKFASEAGFTNPGYINDVIKGRRQLSKIAIQKVIKFFEISSTDEDFFKLLVEYDQCKRITTKD